LRVFGSYRIFAGEISLEMREAIGAPKKLAVDDHRGNAEHALRDSLAAQV
jgi:hypothetical protein